MSTAKSLFIRRESGVWVRCGPRLMNASPNGAPRWRTFGCSVMS
jgi:hypothetical protein